MNSRKHSRLRKLQQDRKELRAVLARFVENYRANMRELVTRRQSPRRRAVLSTTDICTAASAAVDAALSSARERPGRA